jgi:hypothetical protein
VASLDRGAPSASSAFRVRYWTLFLSYQQFENYVLAPRVYKSWIDLSPAAVILSTLAGGILAGFAGALLALPIAALIKVIVVDVILASRTSPRPDDPAADPAAEQDESSENTPARADSRADARRLDRSCAEGTAAGGFRGDGGRHSRRARRHWSVPPRDEVVSIRREPPLTLPPACCAARTSGPPGRGASGRAASR